MQLGDHLGFAGLFVGLVGIALTILWPAKRLVGVLCLVAAAVLGILWGVMTYESWRHPSVESSLPETTPPKNLPQTSPTQPQQSSEHPPASKPKSQSTAKVRPSPQMPVPSIGPEPPVPPDVSLKFVEPSYPSLVIVNTSRDSIARDMKWEVILWNEDLPDRNDPLPIPVSTFDWLKPHTEGGPEDLFGSPLVKPLLKNGDHLFGSAAIDCPTCIKGRAYFVSIVYGEGGWFAEAQNANTGGPLIPQNFLAATRKAYFSFIEKIPQGERIPIKPQ
jgi:hypothetical protein